MNKEEGQKLLEIGLKNAKSHPIGTLTNFEFFKIWFQPFLNKYTEILLNNK